VTVAVLGVPVPVNVTDVLAFAVKVPADELLIVRVQV
jgi:hypothetical protein